jgi:hypothetical protein
MRGNLAASDRKRSIEQHLKFKRKCDTIRSIPSLGAPLTQRRDHLFTAVRFLPSFPIFFDIHCFRIVPLKIQVRMREDENP